MEKRIRNIAKYMAIKHKLKIYENEWFGYNRLTNKNEDVFYWDNNRYILVTYNTNAKKKLSKHLQNVFARAMYEVILEESEDIVNKRIGVTQASLAMLHSLANGINVLYNKQIIDSNVDIPKNPTYPDIVNMLKVYKKAMEYNSLKYAKRSKAD